MPWPDVRYSEQVAREQEALAPAERRWTRRDVGRLAGGIVTVGFVVAQILVRVIG